MSAAFTDVCDKYDCVRIMAFSIEARLFHVRDDPDLSLDETIRLCSVAAAFGRVKMYERSMTRVATTARDSFVNMTVDQESPATTKILLSLHNYRDTLRIHGSGDFC
ncbi:hypothetical protein CAC42_4515 [Sphaceloma murrayae]|uniref:Uncharacterized protein n=1 Tax=Sphaceloma murrayae TaxID=2082308 RepID=A0A2K1QLT4_9PEZI|nr:hypothetical protein CAC42_4515 [Sphaceloma murrayae]